MILITHPQIYLELHFLSCHLYQVFQHQSFNLTHIYSFITNVDDKFYSHYQFSYKTVSTKQLYLIVFIQTFK